MRVNHANWYIEEKNENKYLIFDSTDENKELLKKYSNVWSGIKNKIKAIVAASVIMKMILWKLSLIIMMPYH